MAKTAKTDFAKVKAGDPFRTSAVEWNSILDAAQAYRATQDDQAAGGLLAFLSAATTIRVKNGTGDDRASFDVVGLNTPIFTQTDNAKEFKRRFAFNSALPTKADYYSKFAIMLEPSVSGTIKRAAVGGLAVVQLTVGHASHTHADVTDSSCATLTTGFSGAAKIIWKESGTGTKWAIVLLGQSPRTVLGKTDALIAKSSSGTVSIYSGTPGSETDTGANVTGVYNPFSSVDTTKWVLVSWIDGNPYLTGKEC